LQSTYAKFNNKRNLNKLIHTEPNSSYPHVSGGAVRWLHQSQYPCTALV